ncbi:hypothetical protein [Streptomyces sp. NPDC051211]|uniref:hypothetical protein n=1 Tax=Streptomyces sp. NPDC051211 TaxID=3154643 RepID=UPI00344D6F9A
MGGRQHTQRGRRLRRAALLCALGPLVAALFLCARTGGGDAAVRVQAAAPGVPAGHAPHAAFVCPYDLPACSPFSHVTPGVLPAPPPAVTAPGAEPPPPRPTRSAGAVRPPQPAARAPDLHVLQVLRT